MSETKSDEDEDNAYRVNGFCQRSAFIEPSKKWNIEENNLDRISFNQEFKIKPFLIKSVDEYIKIITDVIGPYDYKNPVFYRAHADANYLNIPASLRTTKGIQYEDFMLQEFERRYPEQFSKCKNTLERLVVMQHYGSFSRCLDVTESPLVALAFVCLDEKKFNSNINKHKSTYGTITVFKAQNGGEDIKGFDSSTVGVLANTAKCEEKFHYGNLEMFYHNDGFGHQLDDFIYFKDIISHSVIVRTKQDNPRIRNQRGAFILVNANEVLSTGNYKVDPIGFMEQVLSSTNEKPLNLIRLKEKNPNLKLNEWDFSFRKINPYSLDNKYPIFQSDPFDLQRLYFRDSEKQQIVFFIPPGCKETMKKQLESLGFTYDFLYPEVDKVFHGIVEKVFGKEGK